MCTLHHLCVSITNYENGYYPVGAGYCIHERGLLLIVHRINVRAVVNKKSCNV